MNFTKSQRIGIRILLVLIFLVQVLIYFKDEIFIFNQDEVKIKYYEIDTVNNINTNYNFIPQHNIKKKDINFSSKEDLMKIKGIGTKLSKRILDYRNLLGGFVDDIQYKDIYGINDTIIEEIRNNFYINKKNIKTIDLNNSTFKEILKHPYLTYNDVKIIFKEKAKNGNIKNLDSLINSLDIKLEKRDLLKKYIK